MSVWGRRQPSTILRFHLAPALDLARGPTKFKLSPPSSLSSRGQPCRSKSSSVNWLPSGCRVALAPWALALADFLCPCPWPRLFSLPFPFPFPFPFSCPCPSLLFWCSASPRLSLGLCCSSPLFEALAFFFFYFGALLGCTPPFFCALLLFGSPCSAPLAHLPVSQQRPPVAILRSADRQAPKRGNWLAPARPPEECSTQWPPEERGKGR